MAADERWYFTKEQLANTPSRKCGYDADKELSNRQQAANFIQDMGQRLLVTQLCINTAIVYMHRFFVYHSFSQFHRNSIAAAALFLAAKVEEQPRKLEHVIKVAHMCLHRDQAGLDPKSEAYHEQAQDLVFNENVLLQTLGFSVAIDHPHTHVVRCCHLVRASKDLAQTSYFMASNSLHLTTMCLQYKPTVVACFCIHLACKWSNWEIPQSNEGKDWFWYVDRDVTLDQLEQLTAEFLVIFDKCPTKLKHKIKSISAATQNTSVPPSVSGSPFDSEPRRIRPPGSEGPLSSALTAGAPQETATNQSSSSSSAAFRPHGSASAGPPPPPASQQQQGQSQPPSATAGTYRDYREKKERERQEREKMAQGAAVPPASRAKADTRRAAVKIDGHHHHHHHHHGALPPNAALPPSSSASTTTQHVPHKQSLPPPSHKPPPPPPVSNPPSHPPPAGPPVPLPSRPLAVTAARDQARREAAHARDATRKRLDMFPSHRPGTEPDLPTNFDHWPDDDAAAAAARPRAAPRKEPKHEEKQEEPAKPQHPPPAFNHSRQRPDMRFDGRPKTATPPPAVPAPVRPDPSGNGKPVQRPPVKKTTPSTPPHHHHHHHHHRPASPHKPQPAPKVAYKPDRNGTAIRTPPRPEFEPLGASPPSAKTVPPITPDMKSSSRESPYPQRAKRQRTPPRKESSPPPIVTPLLSPPPATPTTPGKNVVVTTPNKGRPRTSSSSSEPELVPVVTKLDQIAGYENISNRKSIKLPGRVPEIIPPFRDAVPPASKPPVPGVAPGAPAKPPELIRPFSGPSDATPATADLGAVAFPSPNTLAAVDPDQDLSDPGVTGLLDVLSEQLPTLDKMLCSGPTSASTPAPPPAPAVPPPASSTEPPSRRSDHHHKSEKKKKSKEKHKRKDKEKDKTRDRHKHKVKKEKHKEKEEGSSTVTVTIPTTAASVSSAPPPPPPTTAPAPSAPIKITIPKDKINLSATLDPTHSAPPSSNSTTGLKLKIQKDRLKVSESHTPPPPAAPPSIPSGGIKIKISKDVITGAQTSKESRKRDRSSPRTGDTSHHHHHHHHQSTLPPAKQPRLDTNTPVTSRRATSSSTYNKQNGMPASSNQSVSASSRGGYPNKMAGRLDQTQHQTSQEERASRTTIGVLMSHTQQQ